MFFSNHKKMLLIVLGLAVIAGVGLLVCSFCKKVATPDTSHVLVPPAGEMSVRGMVVCLPHRNTQGPQTLECAFGLKTAEGIYYALDLSLFSQIAPELNIGDSISANGVITPVERLSTNHWQTYPIKGIFSVTDSLKKL